LIAPSGKFTFALRDELRQKRSANQVFFAARLIGRHLLENWGLK